MGLTTVKMRIRKGRRSRKFAEEEFLVDSGANFTVAPGAVLRRLGVEPEEQVDFRLADGQKITRHVGDAYLEFGDKKGYCPVVFGEEGDCNLLGVVTLERFALVLDPLKRELRPAQLMLM
jgi:predicted aspartyl protease